MGEHLRVLMVEDSEDDARLLASEIERAGFRVRWLRVEDPAALARALEEPAWDLALVDEGARFDGGVVDGPAVIARVHDACPDLPTIVVTGAPPADAAHRLAQAGAADFVSRGNLARLAPAIAREVGTAKIRQRLAALEVEVRDQLAELERVQAEGRARNQFVNAISHELRTPLTTILGYAELLEDGVGGELSAEQREYLRQIVEAAVRQEHVVNDLLDYARSEAGTFRLRPEPFDFREVLGRVVESLRPQAAKQRVAIEVAPMPEPLEVEADAQRIGQVLLNFLTNALKFSGAGTAVTVRAAIDGGELACEVQDRGPGIAKHDIPKLFQLFAQLEDGRIRGGTGLGLAISRTIVESHGGRIGVRSRDGEGSLFWFRLPRHPREEAA